MMRIDNIKLKRAMAFIIDVLVYGVVCMYVLSILIVLIKPDTMDDSTKRRWAFLLSMMALIPMVLRDLRISIGKRVMHLCVYSETREKATWRQCLLRNISLLFFPQVEMILFLVTEKRLGDMLAKTVVRTKAEDIKMEDVMDDEKN